MSMDNPTPPSPMPAPGTPQTRILHVDDDEANRYAVSRTLRLAGYLVDEAQTGEEAIAKAHATRPDLVLLDVQLPDIDGFEVARRLRTDPVTRHTPVVHLSAHATASSDRARGLEGGAAAYLTRPLESRELLATIAALVGVHRAEQAARRVSREWQATFDAIPDAIYLLDRYDRIARSNAAMQRACAVLGVPLVGVEHGEAMRAFLGREPDEPPGLLETRLERDVVSSQTGRAYRWTLDPVRDDAGEVVGTVGILTDVSDRRQLAAELQRRNEELQLADRRKDEFLAMLAHELRNPLGAIGAAAAVLEGDARGEATDRVRATVKRQIRHLARLVDDLLDVSRITRGKIELRRTKFDLSVACAQAIASVEPMLESRGHLVEYTKPPSSVRAEIDGDAVRIEQVIANLLDNASKYTDAGGRIELALQVEGDAAVVRVRDNGIGIAPERLESIFEMFVQVDPTIDRGRGGLGIGLTLVRQLVSMHGGTVEAKSAGVGRGSEFIVRLPLADSETALDASATGQYSALSTVLDEPSRTMPPTPTTESEQNRTGDPPVQTTPARRVLIVEDSEDNRLMLRFVVEMKGYEVLEAADGLEGVDVALRERPAVVLVDVGLPGIDGFEVARRIRKEDPQRAMRLIALTGYGSEQDRRASRDAGFDEHLLKPVEQERLFAALEREHA